MLRKEVLREGKSCQEKVKQTIQELKAQHKDKGAVVKPTATAINGTQILTETELQKQITERENLIKKLNARPSNHLLSPTDQTKLNQARQELALLKKRQNTENFIEDDYPYQLRMLNEKHDRLNDKLNGLRTLVRAGDINQLQDLVRQAKI